VDGSEEEEKQRNRGKDKNIWKYMAMRKKDNGRNEDVKMRGEGKKKEKYTVEEQIKGRRTRE
jgi:hypothetical protein